MEPTVIQCVSACTVTVQHEITIPPFDLSIADGAQIGTAVLLIWAVGWCFRALIRAVRSDAKPTEENES